jgi:RimJ/RimL family protein N-acetyltransferase
MAKTGLNATPSAGSMPCVIELHVPAAGDRHALMLRPWQAEDMPALVAEMSREYPTRGLWSHPDDDRPGRLHWTGPRDEPEAAEWLAGQDRGWRNGDWLTFVVVERDETGASASARQQLAGHVALKNREGGGRVGEEETAEVGFWTAAGSRGRGVAPAAVRAVTAWAFGTLSAAGMRQIMLVHDVDNPASCRVAQKAGYPFREISPAKPPYWFTDGHIHVRTAG